jgi:hypothetical protein
MVGAIISDGEEDVCIQRPQHKSKPTAALLEHSEAATLPSQQRHINKFHAAEAARRAAETRSAIDQVRAQPPSDPSDSESPHATPSAGPSVPVSPSRSLHMCDTPGKWGFSEVEPEDGGDLKREDARSNPKPKGEHLLKMQYLLLT